MNVTPITSLVTKVLTKTSGPKNTSDLQSSISVITTAFNISEDDLEKDFIEEGNANVAKLVTQIETTSKSLSAAIDDS